MSDRYNPLTDEDLLRVLDMRENEMPFRQIAERMGRSNGAIAGAIFRIRTDTDSSDPNGHLNGTMPKGWWKR